MKQRRWLRIGRREIPVRQLSFPFAHSAAAREQSFKRITLLVTALAILAVFASTPASRLAVRSAAVRARWFALKLIGGDVPRAEIEADEHRHRLQAVEKTRALLAKTIDEGGEPLARLMKAARMDPETAVIRWGNFNHCLVLSSDVFEVDDSGRSYKLRPNTKSIWVIGLSLAGVSGLFEIPCTDEARAAAVAVGGRIVPQSLQSTNSWGFRGAEPDLKSSLRGLVLGDSVMQGLLVGDTETAPYYLEQYLHDKTGQAVCVLNTGVLGYSMEQYYYTLVAFGDRFRPHFVILSACGNDFGPWDDPHSWAEAAYWMDKIRIYCTSRNIEYLVVPYPGEDMMIGVRNESVYPGKVNEFVGSAGTRYVNPLEEFTNEELRLRIAQAQAGETKLHSELYNRDLLGDNHFSAKGCALWARIVGDRLMLVRLNDKLRGQYRAPSAQPVAEARR
jgi:hypothetical protein